MTLPHHNRRRIATLCLLGALVLYAVSTWYQGRLPALEYVSAFAEAAMIGGIADWFAVTALFRHPLGLKIPHTAIIPRNRARLGRSLSGFIRENFLSEAYVRDSVRRFDVAGALAGWLSRPERRAMVAERLTQAMSTSLSAVRQSAARDFLTRTLRHHLGRINTARLMGSALSVLAAEGRHQVLLDDSLTRLSRWLEVEDNQERVKHFITDTVFKLFNPRVMGREVSMHRLAGWLINERIVEQSARLISEVSDDPDHPLRHHLDRQFADFIEQLRHDPAFARRLDRLRDDLLDNDRLSHYIAGVWEELMDWLARDLKAHDSRSRAWIEHFIEYYARTLEHDAPARDWLNEQAVTLLPALVERNGPRIDAYIQRYLDSLDSDEIVDQIEKNVGNDLQFIRINGTLVGGLIGLTIHAVTQLVLTL
ncbi:DUF445 domain-containing protein [Kushneria marisflavi]|uniref:Uncharacterized protein n=1 Tax=Kushneria marisflavi TaxID=157779 RepID=A0A240UPU4_9GAMM|nr:DUF445 domain-containing protein [Kushneria marisflavi]ART63040.1 hypothetical protein B9H00_08235 [Kushneria marisflavi]RKD84715.1 uncharacterized membrane-anchored protein YjiN (DUF445 family) [Kushneria marisflavi]